MGISYFSRTQLLKNSSVNSKFILYLLDWTSESCCCLLLISFLNWGAAFLSIGVCHRLQQLWLLLNRPFQDRSLFQYKFCYSANASGAIWWPNLEVAPFVVRSLYWYLGFCNDHLISSQHPDNRETWYSNVLPHLVLKFGTNESGAIWWPNLELMLPCGHWPKCTRLTHLLSFASLLILESMLYCNNSCTWSNAYLICRPWFMMQR